MVEKVEGGYLKRCQAELEWLREQASLDEDKKERMKWLEQELNAKYMVEDDGKSKYYYTIENRPSDTTIMLRMTTYQVDKNGSLEYVPDAQGDLVKVRRYAKKMEYQELNNKDSKFTFIDALPSGLTASDVLGKIIVSK